MAYYVTHIRALRAALRYAIDISFAIAVCSLLFRYFASDTLTIAARSLALAPSSYLCTCFATFGRFFKIARQFVEIMLCINCTFIHLYHIVTYITYMCILVLELLIISEVDLHIHR